VGRFIRLYLPAPSAGFIATDAVPAVIGMAVMQPHWLVVSHDQGFPVLGANKPDQGFVPENPSPSFISSTTLVRKSHTAMDAYLVWCHNHEQ
jgi:hypothetical protein